MSKRGYLWRYDKIVKKIKQQPYITKKELLQYLESEVENVKYLDDEMEVGISTRTFERDLREIRNLCGVNIEYSPSKRGYYIEDDSAAFGELAILRMVESFEVYHSLNIAQDLGNVIYPEKECSQGMEHLYKLIYAIKNRLIIRFEYFKFWDNNPNIRTGKPYALKEFKRRWYLLMHDDNDECIKVFGLDRMSALEITSQCFPSVSQPDVEAMFASCYGVTIPANAKPQEVILAFTPLQAKYVKSLPLHDTQKIISETDTELRISLNIYITIELERQILSYGEEVKVIQPKELRDIITSKLQKTLESYD